MGCGCPQGLAWGVVRCSARGHAAVLSFAPSLAAVDHGGCTFQLVEENGVGDGKSDFLSFSPEMVAEQFTLMDAVSTHSKAGPVVLCPPAALGTSLPAPLLPAASFPKETHLHSLIFQELFKKVVPYHCLGCIWSQRDKKGKEHLAPTIRATVSQFNSVANCVIATCLGDRSLKPQQRAKVVERWIEVARVGQRHPCLLPQPSAGILQSMNCSRSLGCLFNTESPCSVLRSAAS